VIPQQIHDGTNRPQPGGRVTIDEPDGGNRLLGIPNLIDRVIQQANPRIQKNLGPSLSFFKKTLDRPWVFSKGRFDFGSTWLLRFKP
jgi:retron-type reverse transcriptase